MCIRDSLRVIQDIGNGVLNLLEVRLYAIELLAGLAHLGGGDQIHGIGDLQGLIHALDAGTDLFYACHCALTCPL